MEKAPNLPIPRFSSDNPYWIVPTEKAWGWLRKDLWPRNNARAFMYATVWEIWKYDVHGAYCVRSATQLTVRVNLRFGMRQQLKDLWFKQRRNRNEKAVSSVPQSVDAAAASSGNPVGSTAEYTSHT